MEQINLVLLSGRDIWMLATVIGCTLFLCDDLIVDLLALIKNRKAKKITETEFNSMNSIAEKKIAIIVANWHESDIIERIVAGNINSIKYKNYEIILGVYPNDTKTLEAARRVEKRFNNVTVVVNALNGPTSKGQMLNQVVRYLESYNATASSPIDMILIQDSEDIIHRYSLKLMNFHAEKFDFIQIPVFSLNIPVSKLTAGIYIDEFIESHTKDMLVRDYYNAALPSAGVGTALSWKVVTKILKLQKGQFLNENTLTEDYHLGLTCHDIGVKSHFACEYFELEDEKTGKKNNEYIATREYFPQKIRQSVRQKTRWSLGISLQGFEERKWKSSHIMERYFLWRDRKGLMNAPLFTTALIYTIYFVSTWFTTGRWPALDYSPLNSTLTFLMWSNLMFSILRIVNRMKLVTAVYGFKMAVLVPVRWILSNFINTSCTYNAVYKWGIAKLRGEMPTWSKTDHMIPVGFGLENKVILEVEPVTTENSITKDTTINT